MRERFLTLTSQLDEEQWRVLGVLACEKKCTASALDRLGLASADCQWLDERVVQGLFLDAGVVHGLPYTRGFSGERAITIPPAYRPLVLRHLAETNRFAALRADGQTVLGDHSLSGFMTALYAGDLRDLQRKLTELRRRSTASEDVSVAQYRLREAVCLPLDADWLLHTWADSAGLLVQQVLSNALVTLEPVEELYRWAIARVDEHTGPRPLRLLFEHAILRSEHQTLVRLGSRFPTSEQLTLRVAESYVRGDLEQAQGRLSELTEAKGGAKSTVCPTSVTALLALLALSRPPPLGSTLAKRLLQRHAATDEAPIAGFSKAEAEAAVSRAIRNLLRRLTLPESGRLRLSPHHLASDAPGWETLLTALTVQQEDSDDVNRLAWTQRLVTDGTRWHEAGYVWLARQALHLAKALSVEPTRELDALIPCQPGEQLLASLLEREPEWRRALRALDSFTQTAERGEAIVSRRVAWFLDMSNGELAKPSLEDYRSGTGWTRGRRVDFDELRAQKTTLPPEDCAILSVLDSAPRHGRMPPEVVEALCGHPRVFNGARGRTPVEVVRGVCRVETRQEHGHLLIQVEPAGGTEGVHVVVESETRVVVYRVSSPLAKLIQLLPVGIRIPQSHQKEGLAVLSRLAEHVEIRSPELGACRSVVADSTPCLRISSDAGAWWVEFGVRPFGEFGRFFPPGLGRPAVAVHSGDDLLDTDRNLNEEEARYHALLAKCPSLMAALLRERQGHENETEPVYSFTLDEEELYSLLSELRTSGLVCSLEWKNGNAITSRGKVSSASLQGSLRRVKGWYLVNGSIALDEVTPVALADLVRMPFTKSGRFIRLPSGDFVEVERRVRQVLARLASVGQLPARGSTAEIRVPEAAFDTVRSLVEAASAIHVEPTAAEWLTRLATTMASEPPLPQGLNATLRHYQIEGYQWLWRYSQLGLGVCLADDMGLGKTLQVLALLLTRAAAGPTLVIAPTSVCTNWMDEMARFAPSLTALEYTGKSRTAYLARFKPQSGEVAPDVLVASYALLQADAAELAAIEWNTVVLDEAQFIKNPHSLRAKAAFGLTAHYRVAMTGTPVENHLGDLWSVFHFLNPSLLGSFKHFQLSYLKPIERDRDSDQQETLKKLVQPFMLRRRKDEVLSDLPPVTVLRHEVRLSEDETLRYALLRRHINDKLRTTYGKRDHKLQVLAEITRLRRFCCHPRLVFPDAPTESSKMQTFLDLAEELRDNGHHALVFSQFVDFLELVREQLDERGIRYLYLDGSTPKATRHTRVKAFQSGEAELFLISLKAGGFGLNLTGADYVIHLDPWWNPAVEAQATDRAHRIGQQRPVTVYRLVTKDSIEERIVALHQEKRAIADALFDGYQGAAELSDENLMELLGFE